MKFVIAVSDQEVPFWLRDTPDVATHSVAEFNTHIHISTDVSDSKVEDHASIKLLVAHCQVHGPDERLLTDHSVVGHVTDL